MRDWPERGGGREEGRKVKERKGGKEGKKGGRKGEGRRGTRRRGRKKEEDKIGFIKRILDSGLASKYGSKIMGIYWSKPLPAHP